MMNVEANQMHFSAEDVDSVIYFTDGAPEGLYNALEKFSSATKVNGLVLQKCIFADDMRDLTEDRVDWNFDAFRIRKAIHSLSWRRYLRNWRCRDRLVVAHAGPLS